jgi:hypothetical protein
MKKSSLFISGILTTFILAPIVVTTSSSLALEQAAQVAAQYLGRTDLYSADETVLNGMKAFLVTFSSGDVVYVSPDGQVLAYIPAAVVSYQNPLSSQPVQPGSSYSNDDGGGGDDD